MKRTTPINEQKKELNKYFPSSSTDLITSYLKKTATINPRTAEPSSAMFSNPMNEYFRKRERRPIPPVIETGVPARYEVPEYDAPPPHPRTHDSCNPMAIGGIVHHGRLKKRNKKNVFFK